MDRSTGYVFIVAALIALAGCSGPAAPGAGTSTTDGSTPETATPTPTPGSPTETPTTPEFEAFVFDHAGLGHPIIEGGITHDVDGPFTRGYYVTTVASSEATGRFNESLLSPEASGFVRNTSYSESSLVVIQSFPASSVPDYRVEPVRRDDKTLRVSINDSSAYGTDDITVETVLLRVRGPTPERVVVTTEEGDTFETDAGVVTVTPKPTPTPAPDVELPYVSENGSENVDEPRDVRIRNVGEETNGYALSVVFHDRPDCLDETPACGEPTKEIPILERTGKLRPGANLTVPDVAARTAPYTIEVRAEVPGANDSRRTVTDLLDWELTESAGNVLVTITDERVQVSETTVDE